eukprot:s5294_g1.t4
MSALDGLQFSGSLAPCQAQLEELSAKLQQDRDLGDVMGIAAVEWGGASTKGLCRRIASPFQSIEFYGSVERGKMNVNSCMLAFSALRLLSINAQLEELSAKLQQDRDLGDVMGIWAVHWGGEAACKTSETKIESTTAVRSCASQIPMQIWQLQPTDVLLRPRQAQLEELSAKLQQDRDLGDAQLEELSAKLQQGNVPAECSEESVREALAFAGENCEGKHIDSLINLLGKHVSNLAVCSQVCAALENLTFTDVDNQSRIVDLGGIELILHVLETHEDADGALLRPVVDSLWNLTFNAKAVERATATGGVRRVASVLAKNLATPDVLGGVCAVLLNLAVVDENRHQIVQCGGAESMVQAIKAHQGREEVVEHACQALYLLAYHTELRFCTRLEG